MALFGPFLLMEGGISAVLVVEAAPEPEPGKTGDEAPPDHEPALCAICIEPLVAGDPDRFVALCTGRHEFHRTCLRKWSNVKAAAQVVTSCPVCRERISHAQLKQLRAVDATASAAGNSGNGGSGAARAVAPPVMNVIDAAMGTGALRGRA